MQGDILAAVVEQRSRRGNASRLIVNRRSVDVELRRPEDHYLRTAALDQHGTFRNGHAENFAE